MKPILKYRGGKSKELPEILPFIPKFSGRYIEPFFGGGAMFFELSPKNSIINDINERLITFYKNIQLHHKQVRKELEELQAIYEKNRAEFEYLKRLTPDLRVYDANETLYYQIREMFNGDTLPKYNPATVYYFINKTSYSGMIRYNAQGKFNVPYGRYKNFNTKLITDKHIELLEETDIYNLDYSDIFNIASSNDFIFLDPPYDCVFNDYGNIEMEDGFSEDMHRKLAEDFKNLHTPALMVIGKTPLTEELYGSCIVHEYEKSYAVNIRNRFKSETKHILVRN
ncbi:Dam family site-specific DNA-(adenine-N6)-methyltransferase [Actinobacillus genomosp. 1]|uniref:DNA adenine methylase n=1 Tax=Actinobacillus genomosp. 1 TaxID=254839 RepID=UPI0024430A8A|nr:Dam family site-specific DNA-(adenine-N6)-methyltransferase [Actinobacillus genomosp. 1]WGE33136.1 Dam family site-specific DNA-(adenine-N6)-methyltransferase [Actinobacillus genomosp. 1]